MNIKWDCYVLQVELEYFLKTLKLMMLAFENFYLTCSSWRLLSKHFNNFVGHDA